jgi:hypothetical protein
MKTVATSNKREEYGRWFGMKCKYPERRFWTETETYICEVCHREESYVYEITELLHVPMTQSKQVGGGAISFRNVEWGHKGRSFWACKDHTEIDLDKYIEKEKQNELSI